MTLAIPLGIAPSELAVFRMGALDAGLPDPQFVAEPIAAARYLAPDAEPGQKVALFSIAANRELTAPQLAFVDAGAVHGIDNLHIADASTMPSITRGNPNLPTAMIGARIAASLLRLARAGIARH